METLEEKVEDLSCRLASRQESVNPPSFFGALDRNEFFTGRKKELESLEKAFKKLALKELVLEAVRERLKFMVFADSEAAGSHLLPSNMLGATWNVTPEGFTL